jgi:hypothetical protein
MFNFEINPVVGKAEDTLYELIEQYRDITTQLMKLIPKRAAKILVFPNITLTSQQQRKFIDDMIPDLGSFLPVLQHPSGPIVQIPFTDFLIQSQEKGRPKVTCRCSDKQPKPSLRQLPFSAQRKPIKKQLRRGGKPARPLR